MSKIDDAIKFAVDAHKGQVRKLGGLPYIFHPTEVAQIVAQMTTDEDVIAAAILHDTVEDTKTTFEEITNLFGERVAKLVGLETEDKRENEDKAATWRIRKEEALEKLANETDISAKMICLGDKLSNIRSLYRNHLVQGEEMWNTFNEKDPRNHK